MKHRIAAEGRGGKQSDTGCRRNGRSTRLRCELPAKRSLRQPGPSRLAAPDDQPPAGHPLQDRTHGRIHRIELEEVHARAAPQRPVGKPLFAAEKRRAHRLREQPPLFSDPIRIATRWHIRACQKPVAPERKPGAERLFRTLQRLETVDVAGNLPQRNLGFRRRNERPRLRSKMAHAPQCRPQVLESDALFPFGPDQHCKLFTGSRFLPGHAEIGEYQRPPLGTRHNHAAGIDQPQLPECLQTIMRPRHENLNWLE